MHLVLWNATLNVGKRTLRTDDKFFVALEMLIIELSFLNYFVLSGLFFKLTLKNKNTPY